MMFFKRWLMIVLVIALSAGGLSKTRGEAWADQADTQGSNLLLNSDFEAVTTKASWLDQVAPEHVSEWKAAGNPVFAVDDSVYYSGARSVSITGTVSGTDRGAITLPAAGIEAGKSYMLTGMYKLENVSDQVLVRFQYKRSGTSSISYAFQGERGTKDWTYFSHVVHVAADMDANPQGKVEAFLEKSAGTVWFDQLSMREYIPLRDITLDRQTISLQPGETGRFQAAYEPENTSDTFLEWASSNTVVASVYQSGEVAAHATGHAVISAMSPQSGITRQGVVTVGTPPSLIAESYLGSISENGVLDGQLAAADSSGASVSFELAAAPRNGTVSVLPDGSFRYYPNRGYAGADSFIFLAYGADGGPAAAAAKIEVLPLDSPPLLDLTWYSTEKNTPLTGQLGRLLSEEQVEWTLSTSPRGEMSLASDGSFTYTPAPNEVGYDTFEVTATTASGKSATGKTRIFVVPDEEDLLDQLTSIGNEGIHPRVFADAGDFASIRELIGQDEYVTKWFDQLKREADRLLDTEPYGYLANGGSNSNVRDLLIRTSMMYQLTGDEAYARRAIEELKAAAAYPDWGGRYNNMLSLTYMTLGFSLAYDWLYDAMTEQQRNMVREAVMKHAFSHALSWYRGEFTHNGEYNNINLVDNGSFSVAALAMLGDEEKVTQAGLEILRGSYRKLQNTLRFFTEDGSWPEGPHYWQYGTEFLFFKMAAMHRTLGTDYGLAELEGVKESGEYPLHLWGPGGFFNFYDSATPNVHPQTLWMADFYDQPHIAWYAGELTRRKGAFSPYYLLFYRPGMFDELPPSLDRTFTGIESISMRSGWTNLNDTFASVKGFNDTLLSHIDMDAGTFVFDALGERWATDLGMENYNLPGFWDYAGGQRWTYYRKGAQGQNVMIMNPESNPVFMQDYDARAPLVRSASKPRGAFGIIDLTERYPKDALSYRRGLMLTGDRQQLIVQDEFDLKSSSELYWFMHTEAHIEVLGSGQEAVLTQKDKKLYVKMLDAPEGAAFSEMMAQPLEGTPNPSGQTVNHGIRKLVVHMAGANRGRLSLWMVPLTEEAPLPEEAPEFRSLDDWSIPDGPMQERDRLPEVNSILVDGSALAGFDPQRTYYEWTVPYDQRSKVPEIGVVSDFDAAVLHAEGIPGKTYIDVTDPSNPGVRNRYTVALVPGPLIGDPPPGHRLPIQEVTASASPQASYGYTPDKTIDGDYETRWTSEGSHWIQYDLGENRKVGAVSIAFFSGETRRSYFTVTASTDGVHWNTVYSDGLSSGTTTQPEVFQFPEVTARFIRINGSGNTSNQWNNYTEVGIFRPMNGNGWGRGQ